MRGQRQHLIGKCPGARKRRHLARGHQNLHARILKGFLVKSRIQNRDRVLPLLSAVPFFFASKRKSADNPAWSAAVF
jgi:hypothetical protein